MISLLSNVSKSKMIPVLYGTDGLDNMIYGLAKWKLKGLKLLLKGVSF